MSNYINNVNFWNRFRREFSLNGDTPLVALNTKRLESWLIDLKSIKHTNMAKLPALKRPAPKAYTSDEYICREIDFVRNLEWEVV